MTPGRRLAIKYSVLILLTVGALLLMGGSDGAATAGPVIGDPLHRLPLVLIVDLMGAVLGLDWWAMRPPGSMSGLAAGCLWC